MAIHVTARQRARAQIIDEILEQARRQLASHGAASLSLRSIARELGMVSSAIYRYFESRDALLTTLIIETYDALGDEAERAAADSAGDADVERWVTTANAIRAWALAAPHEYMLVFGSPVPGYAAPDDTVAPGTRVTFALLSIVRDAAVAGRLTVHGDDVEPDALSHELARLAQVVDLPVPPAAMLATLAAWTQLFGLLGFEITNQTRGVVEDHGALFAATARLGARSIGLSDRPG
jgi:AcrR family transcriptional regulator